MMKKCPFCAEEIQEEAVKCRYCNEFLDESMRPADSRKEEEALPLYFRSSFIVLLFLIFPVLALPSIWLHPKLKLVWKVVLTGLAAASLWTVYVAYLKLSETWNMINNLGY